MERKGLVSLSLAPARLLRSLPSPPTMLPLATSYTICESFGFERGVNHTFRETPIFNGLFTGMLVCGALVALIPSLPLIQLLILVQVINRDAAAHRADLHLAPDRRPAYHGHLRQFAAAERHRLRHDGAHHRAVYRDAGKYPAAALGHPVLAVRTHIGRH